jgi:hypothetical protein
MNKSNNLLQILSINVSKSNNEAMVLISNKLFLKNLRSPFGPSITRENLRNSFSNFYQKTYSPEAVFFCIWPLWKYPLAVQLDHTFKITWLWAPLTCCKGLFFSACFILNRYIILFSSDQCKAGHFFRLFWILKRFTAIFDLVGLWKQDLTGGQKVLVRVFTVLVTGQTPGHW